MKVFVNGEARALEGPSTVRAAIVDVQGDETSLRGIAVALNGEVIPRARWDEVELSDSDSLEVLRAVGGG